MYDILYMPYGIRHNVIYDVVFDIWHVTYDAM